MKPLQTAADQTCLFQQPPEWVCTFLSLSSRGSCTKNTRLQRSRWMNLRLFSSSPFIAHRFTLAWLCGNSCLSFVLFCSHCGANHADTLTSTSSMFLTYTPAALNFTLDLVYFIKINMSDLTSSTVSLSIFVTRDSNALPRYLVSGCWGFFVLFFWQSSSCFLASHCASALLLNHCASRGGSQMLTLCQENSRTKECGLVKHLRRKQCIKHTHWGERETEERAIRKTQKERLEGKWNLLECTLMWGRTTDTLVQTGVWPDGEVSGRTWDRDAKVLGVTDQQLPLHLSQAYTSGSYRDMEKTPVSEAQIDTAAVFMSSTCTLYTEYT